MTAEEGSLSAAARALNMTQPTLGRQVAALEKELNVTLFERVSQGLVLTSSGLQLLDHVRQMGQAASSFALSASGQEQGLEGRVCISASEVDSVFRLPAIAEIVRREEPGIVLDFSVSNEVSDLKRREADIALRSFRPNQPDLITRRLLEERIWFYGSPDYLRPYANVSTPDDIASIDLIGYDRGEQYKNALKQKGWPVERINFPLMTRFWLLQIELVKRGMGVTLLPEDVGDGIAGLQRGFSSWGPFMTLDIWLVTHRELHTSRRVRRVFDLIVTALGESSGL